MGGLKLYIFFFFIFSSDFEHIIVRDLLRLRLCQAKVRPSPSWFLCKKFIPSDCDALWSGVDDISENVICSISKLNWWLWRSILWNLKSNTNIFHSVRGQLGVFLAETLWKIFAFVNLVILSFFCGASHLTHSRAYHASLCSWSWTCKHLEFVDAAETKMCFTSALLKICACGSFEPYLYLTIPSL